MINFVTPLLTILGSGLVVAIVTHIMSSAKEEKEFLRKKLELVYIDGQKFQDLIITIATAYLNYTRGAATSGETIGELAKHADAMPDLCNELTMLCNVYFPNLVPSLNAILDQRNKIGLTGARSLLKDQSGDDEIHQELSDDFRILVETGEKFNKEVFAEAQRINRIKWF